MNVSGEDSRRLDLVRLTAETIRKAVSSVLSAEAAVSLGYLFGSAARDKLTPLSDIDVAVLLDGRPETRPEVLDRLAEALTRSLGTDAIDLVLLNAAPPPIRYRVIRDGLLLVCRDQSIRERFESDTVRRYLDFKPLRDGAFRDMQKALGEPG
jgi:predicted nucleotidyltransferase